MTDPAQPRPVPGPPGAHAAPATPDGTAAAPAVATGPAFAGLTGRPVAEHVAVYEAEHERLQHELSTIDQL